MLIREFTISLGAMKSLSILKLSVYLFGSLGHLFPAIRMPVSHGYIFKMAAMSKIVGPEVLSDINDLLEDLHRYTKLSKDQKCSALTIHFTLTVIEFGPLSPLFWEKSYIFPISEIQKVRKIYMSIAMTPMQCYTLNSYFSHHIRFSFYPDVENNFWQ